MTDGARRSGSMGSAAWRQLRRNQPALAGLVFLAAISLAAAAAPLLASHSPLAAVVGGKLCFPALASAKTERGAGPREAWRGIDWRSSSDLLPAGVSFRLPAPIPYSPADVSLTEILEPPSRRHWLGTDDLGRDVAARLLHGARVSLAVGVAAAAIALVVGTMVGALAGYSRGATDWILSRVIEVVLCFPLLFLILAVVAVLEPSIWNVIVAIGLTGWTSEARYVRGEFLRIRELDYTQAARAAGARAPRLILRHILPNALAPLIVSASFNVGHSILIEGALSFLGLGVQPPQPSWGSMLAAAEGQLETAWWLALFPGLALFLTVTACNLVGEGLRDSTDPRLLETTA